MLWIRFPVWRELKPDCEIVISAVDCLLFGYAFPFEGNWNCFFRFRFCFFWFRALDTLSRLKGIETRSLKGIWPAQEAFGYAFPFEGNWNVENLCLSKPHWFGFGYAFPFEGNWNLLFLCQCQCQCQWLLWIRFPVWRELKLYILVCSEHYHPFFFGYAFPFEGNWNRLGSALTTRKSTVGCFGYAFPFEGNWNFSSVGGPATSI